MKRAAPIRGIVFDLDDTLYPELDFVRSGLRAVAEAFAADLGPPEQSFNLMWRDAQGDDRRRVFDLALATAGQLPHADLVARMVQCYRRHTPVLTLHPDADRALSRLAGRFKLGILSD